MNNHRVFLIISLCFCHLIIAQKKKVPAPDGNNHYHTYEKKENIVRIYDSGNNLVREAHISNNVAYDFFNKDILLNYLDKLNFTSNELFNSKKSINFLYNLLEREDIIQSDEQLGYIKKFKTNDYGFIEMTFSTSRYDNESPPPLDPNEKLTKEEIEYIKHYEKNKDSIEYLNRLDKSFDKNSEIYTYTQYMQGNKWLELYFKFNQQELVSDALFIITNDAKTPNESKSINYKKATYNDHGKIVELKEYRTKNYKQFEELISKKGEDFFLDTLFKDTTKHFEFFHFETTSFKYKKNRLICSEIVQHYSDDRLIEDKYKYDENDRMVEVKLYQNNELYTKETFKYD